MYQNKKAIDSVSAYNYSSIIGYLRQIKSIILLHRLQKLQIDSMNLYSLRHMKNDHDLWWQNILTGISPAGKRIFD